MLYKVWITIFLFSGVNAKLSKGSCIRAAERVQVDFDSLSTYSSFNFQPIWIREGKHFWKSTDFDFEARYTKSYSHRVPQKHLLPHVEVFLLPFSHNDPGWIQTYEGYFYSSTKKIINNAVAKLAVYENMTFAWSEISYLSKWWDEASFTQKEALKNLVHNGKFEILTGGFVMPDEATNTLFALVNQLIEGHQWLYSQLKIVPTVGWSIDAFGHSSTMPYLLKKSGIQGMMIQRIHYSWKNWLAETQNGDFIWMPRWSNCPEDGIVCHNAHYDLYPTKHSCGPHPNTCMKFDFRKIPEKHEEHLIYQQEVNSKNLEELADALIGQYRRTASLTTHNKVITGLGGDFRFDEAIEWDQQFKNYQKLFDFVNTKKYWYHTSVKFGTLQEYFQTLRESNVTMPTFMGDFLPYRNATFIYFGYEKHRQRVNPAYWTGYFSTRPFWKRLSREAEDELYKAEILFTFTYNLMRQRGQSSLSLYRNYDNLVYARKMVAIFAHHDGITGTSPRSTMLDFAKKLTKAWNFARNIQKIAVETIWEKELNITTPPLRSEKTRPVFNKMSENIPLKLYATSYVVKKLIIFNGLAWKRSQLVRLKVEDTDLMVKGPQGEYIMSQINPIPTQFGNGKMYEFLFIAELPPMSLGTYEVSKQTQNTRWSTRAVVAKTVCRNCKEDPSIKNLQGNEIKLENSRLAVHFNGLTGQVTRLQDKALGKMSLNVSISYGRYDSSFGSGAYLLRPFVSTSYPIVDNQTSLYVFDGPVMSEVLLISKKIKYSTWIIKGGASSTELNSVIFVANTLNSTAADEYGEYFMRIQTNLLNCQTPLASKSSYKFSSEDKPHPIFFTDTNGLAVEKRVYNSKLPYQANHYPITHYAFIQDPMAKLRLSLVVDRTHGITSSHMGRMELIFFRRLRFDDSRGMEEGVMDNEISRNTYALKLEAISSEKTMDDNDFNSWKATLNVQKLSKYLNHEPTIFLYDALTHSKHGRISLFSNDLPDNVYLLNLRTVSRPSTAIKSVPSRKALLTLQYFGHNEDGTSFGVENSDTFKKLNFSLLLRNNLHKTNLVGTKAVSNETSRFNTMKDIPLGKPYQLSSYLVQF